MEKVSAAGIIYKIRIRTKGQRVKGHIELKVSTSPLHYRFLRDTDPIQGKDKFDFSVIDITEIGSV